MHASDTTVVSCTVAGRAWSLATRDGRYALSDDVRGRVYVGDKRGLSTHAPPDVLLALSVELEKAQRPLLRCAGCGVAIVRDTFLRLPVAMEGVQMKNQYRQGDAGDPPRDDRAIWNRPDRVMVLVEIVEMAIRDGVDADLKSADLRGADLRGADLRDADLGDWERGENGFARRKP